MRNNIFQTKGKPLVYLAFCVLFLFASVSASYAEGLVNAYVKVICITAVNVVDEGEGKTFEDGGGFVIGKASEIEIIGGGGENITTNGSPASDTGNDGAGGTIYLDATSFSLNVAAPARGGSEGRNSYDPDVVKTSVGGGGTPQISLEGNGNTISNGDLTTSVTDNTDFGQVLAGGASTLPFTVNNTGTADLTISSIQATSGDAALWSETLPGILVVPASGSLTFDLSFSPTVAGNFSSVVQIISDSGTDPTFTFAISGEGISPEISVEGNGTEIASGDNTPSAADFTDYGNIILTDTQDYSFTIKNTGSSTLNLSATPVTISGTNAGDWSVLAQPATTVAAAGDVSFTLRFSPSALGLRAATVSIGNDDLDEAPYTFDIQGAAVKPVIEVEGNGNAIANGDNTPEATDFTDFESVVLEDSVISLFVVKNTGTSQLELTNVPKITLSGADASEWYVLEEPDSITTAGGQTECKLVFLPTSIGTKTATVTIVNSDWVTPSYAFDITGVAQSPEIAVYGNGNAIADGDVTPQGTDNSDFGNTYVSENKWREFSIKNEGTSQLNLGAPKVALSGADAAEFSIETMPGDPVVAGDSTVFRVSFNPTGTGLKSAVVEVLSDDLDEPLFDFAIQGTGVSSVIEVHGNGTLIGSGDVTPAVADFTDYGLVIKPDSVIMTYVLKNTGTGALNLTSYPQVSIAGADASSWYVLDQPDSIIAASGQTDFKLVFQSTTLGVKNATVSITSNDLSTPTYTFDITAEAQSPEISVEGNGTEIASGDNTPSTADFTDYGNVILTDTQDYTFTIKNTGSSTLNLSATPVTISGTNAADWSVLAQPTTTVAAAGDVSFTLRFSPSALGLREATVSIGNDDLDEAPYVFDIQGTAVKPVIEVEGNGNAIANGDNTPETADFTDFESVILTDSVISLFVVKNTGTSQLELTNVPKVTLSGADASEWYVLEEPDSITAQGGQTSFRLVFLPSSVGTKNATVTIVNSDLVTPSYTFDITGVAQSPEIAIYGNGNAITDGDVTPLTTDNRDFGNTYVSANKWREFSIKNEGSSQLDLGTPKVALSGADAAKFSIETMPGDPVAAGDSTVFRISFNPTTLGVKSAVIEVLSDDLDESLYNFTIQGTGVGSEVSVVRQGVEIVDGDNTPEVADGTDFESVNVYGDTVQHSFFVKNSGDATLIITAGSFVGGDASSFSVDFASALPANVLAGDSIEMVLTFDPTDLGALTSELQISTNDVDEGTYNFTVTGTGIGQEIDLMGNSLSIANQDTTPQVADFTDYGDLIVGTGTIAHTFQIHNTGNDTLWLTGTPFVSILGTGATSYQITQPSSSFVLGGAFAEFDVTFDPIALGEQEAVVIIKSNDADEGFYEFDITGNAVSPEIEILGNNAVIVNGDFTASVADSTDFGLVLASDSLSIIYTIKNTGTSPLNLTGTPEVSLFGGDASLWEVTELPATTIAAGDSTTFELTYKPVTLGAFSAVVRIESDDIDESTYIFAIEGGSISPEIVVEGNNKDIESGDNTPSIADLTDYGNVVQIDTLEYTYTIKNNGTTGLVLSGTPAINITGTNASDWAVLTQPVGPVAVNDSVSFTLRFLPGGLGLREATVEISTNDLDENPFTFNIEGVGVKPVMEVHGNGSFITNGDITPAEIDFSDFGDVVLLDSADAYFAIKNAGTSELLLIGDPKVSISGADASEFYIISEPDSAIVAGDQTGFRVVFLPNSIGTKTATITIANDDWDASPYTFTIQGEALSSEITVYGKGNEIVSGDITPSTVDGTDFEVALVSDGTVWREFVIKNNGTSLLDLQAPNISGTHSSEFAINALPKSILMPGDSVITEVSFSPTSLGLKSAVIEVSSNDLDEGNYTFAIQGTGVSPEVSLRGLGIEIIDGDNTPEVADGTSFGEVILDREYQDQTFVIYNTGTEALDLTSTGLVEISGSESSDFSIVRLPVSPVAVGDTTSFVIRFTPQALGSRSAIITFDNNDLDETVFDFAISGVGVSPEVEVSGNGVAISNGSSTVSNTNNTDFGSLSIGVDTVTYEYTITNSGTSDLNLSGSPLVAISGANATDFEVVELPSTSIGVALNSAFKLKFSPSDVGIREALVTIINDDLDEGTYTFKVEGNGLTPEIVVEGNSREIVNGDITPSVNDLTNFGNILVDIGSLERTFEITNAGNLQLNLTGSPVVSLSGDIADFSVTTFPATAIAVGGISPFSVVFNPQSAGIKQVVLTIESDDLNEPSYSFTLQGVGVDAEIAVSGNGVEIVDGSTVVSTTDNTSFGEMKVSGETKVHSFTIENTGNGELSFTSAPIIEIDGLNKGDFTVVTQPGSTILAASANTVFQIEFNPSAIGQRVAQIIIGNSDLDEGTFTFQIEGVGTLAKPVAENDYITLNEETPTYIDVQANDSDDDGQVLTTAIIYKPLNGLVSVTNGDSLLYTPNEDFSGEDNLTYQICDPDGLCDTATVAITVVNLNSKPIAVDDEGFTLMNQSVELDVQDNDTDPDGESFITNILTNPSNGVVSVISQSSVEYIPNIDFYGEDAFDYTIVDAAGELDTARVTVTVSLVNKAPIAVIDTAYVVQNRSVEVEVMANDSDPDGDPLTLQIVGDPVNGTAGLLGTDKIIYAPENGFFGSDQVFYSICDQYGFCDTTSLIVITLYPSDRPVAVNDEATERANTELVLDVQANDIDTRNLGLTTLIISPPVNGSASVNSDQEIVYMPNYNFAGLDRISYQICDTGGLCDTASVEITVLAWVNYPTAVNDEAVTPYGSSVIIDVLANDTEPDGLGLSLFISKNPANGSVSINTYKQIVYTPISTFDGTDVFEYAICNPDGLCDTASVFVTVSNPPQAVSDVISVIKGGTLFIDVTENDIDPDGDLDPSSVRIIEEPMSGNSVRIEDEGIVIYDSRVDFTGQDYLIYEVCDLTGKCDTDTIFVFVEVPVSEVLVTKKGLSPNGDGINDTWIVEGIEYFPYNKVKIFNRWGDTVFEMEGYNNEDVLWDGSSNRSLSLGSGTVPEGTYFYVIELGNGERPLTGFIEVKQ
ncbi:choice-of-anchor D domain-containing protein [Flammeovirgaceae bacterium SG7u.111]|nr:choice-of-anchor D domain-containing protein [Flammeovirgaceae bacterium SG7u.132]WPO34377.1 choice-of-anchor D domain-containing protein [Flammeovirgaceae bacterium SG7u.111]